jgi:2-amino-4-hydroxy-6-hydroxymethyldihydropteridine diphosphokinase
MNPPAEVFLALGTNLGDRAQNLAHAREQLKDCVTINQTSTIYKTPPWGVVEQPAFLNQVMETSTVLSPIDLLSAVKNIEAELGRVPSVRFGPRLIDIDILLYDGLQLNSTELVIPHPRMFERAFVMLPLNEIAPDLVPPGQDNTVSEILNRLDRSGIVKWTGQDD